MPTLATPVTVRFTDQNGTAVSLEGGSFRRRNRHYGLQGNQTRKGLHLLLSGDRDYYVMISQFCARYPAGTERSGRQERVGAVCRSP